jgi:hypothetical protein
MDAGQFNAFMAMMTKSVGGGGGGDSGGKLIAKYVHINTFGGKVEDWEDWSFTFKRTVRSMSQRAFDCIELAESSIDDVTSDDLTDDLDKKRSGELYDILCQNCAGEAMSLIKSVTDMEGFRAWQVLYRKYNPKTMARGVRMLIEIVGPPKIKDLNDIESAIQKWENKLVVMKSQFGDGLTERMQIAVFTNMMPVAIQDYIYSIVEEKSLYVNIKEKVRGMVSNKVAIGMGPAPMDVGGLHGHHEEEWNEEEEYGVGGVDMNTKCYRCQGYGHFSRDCATKMPEKGKGKGKGQAPDKGKGKGKDQSPDKGKGKGKPFAGFCWNCSQTGHRSNNCPNAKVQSVDEEVVEENTEIGGVWMIGNVEATFTKVQRKSRGARKSSNRFQALAENDEDVIIAAVEEEAEKAWTRPSGMLFNVANVAKPLASAVKVCQAGNRVMLDLSEPGKSFVENISTGERMMLKEDRGTFVFEVKYLDDGQTGHITLDSGAGVSVWPKKMKESVKMLPAKKGLKMVAANGTAIENIGQKIITFKGEKSPFKGRA